MTTAVIIGAVVLCWLFMSKKAAADPKPEEPPATSPETDPAVPRLPSMPTLPGDGSIPGVFAPIIVPKGPGSSPTLAVTRSAMWPGFDGYVRVTTGDTLIKIAAAAKRLDGPTIPWRSIRDEQENAWCKAQTPPNYLETYGLDLVQCYGGSVGVDCEVVAGWKARRYSHITGIFPVLRVRQP